MEDNTTPNKQTNNHDCSGNAETISESEVIISPKLSPVNQHVPSASATLRRRRSLSNGASGNEPVNSKPFGKLSMEIEKDKNAILNNIEYSSSVDEENRKDSNSVIKGDSNDHLSCLNEESSITDVNNDEIDNAEAVDSCQKGSVDEENKKVSTAMNGNSVIIGDPNDDLSCLNEKNIRLSTAMNGDSVITGDSNNDDCSCLNEDSTITDAKNDEIDNSEVVDSNTRGLDDSSTNILFDLAGLVIKAVKFQVNMLIMIVGLMIKLFTFPVWVIYSWYMFVMDPFQIMRRGKRYVMHKAVSFVSERLKEHRYVWRLGLKFGWGCLWSVYVCVILVGLLVSAFIMGGIVTRIMVEEPIRMTENLNFDYTAKSPVAYVPIIRSPGVTCGVDSKDHVEVGGMVDGVRVIPPNHHLQVTVSLTLPESDYNRNLGIFQVRVDFLTANGKVLASSRRPSMLQFKSLPIRLLSTFLKAAPLVTGYTSESQKLKVNLKGFTEGFIPTACLRVAIEQRAEFHPGGGIPEMYAASLALESELPFLKRMLWYWKTTLFVWVSMMLFAAEFLFALLCCKPLLIPRLGLRHDSNSNNRTGSQNNPPIGR